MDFIDAETSAYYQWLEWVVLENRELDFVENELVRKYSNIKSSISVNTLKNSRAVLPQKVMKR
jgi:hypothetical protein